MPETFVGFYWTFPTPRVGFTDLCEDDPEVAAGQSKTIRYQVARVRAWVKENAGRLVDELVFLEASPDRGTDTIRARLDKAKKQCLKEGATFLYVDFAQRFRWRGHDDLLAYLDDNNIPSIGLSPEVITIDGERIDPIKHFRLRRRQDKEAAGKARVQARADVLELVPWFGNGPGANQAIANALNAMGKRTAACMEWTADNVRKIRQRHGGSPTPPPSVSGASIGDGGEGQGRPDNLA